MLNLHGNITQVFLLQEAIWTILNQMVMKIDIHTACIISHTNSNSDHGVHLNEFPTITGHCDMVNKELTDFIKHIEHGVSLGCSFFIAAEPCALPFLNNFLEIHNSTVQKYATKMLVILDTQNSLTYDGIIQLLRHSTVKEDLPLTLIFQPDIGNNWINIWSAFPYTPHLQMYNRFYVGNISWQYDKEIIPQIIDLGGMAVYGAFIHYPPYSAYYYVASGSGNAQLYKSNQNLTVKLDGRELTVLLEFCVKYNCRLTARLDYDEELWLGEFYPNQTDGIIGALQKRDANVTCAAVYLWDNVYPFTQFSSIIQRAIITHIVPKPLRLPYWQTPILPFTGFIWGVVMGTFLIATVALFLVNVKQSGVNGRRKCETSGLFDSIYDVFTLSIFQVVVIRIKRLSDAVVYTMILLYALVIGNLYLSGLASVLTITRYEEPINSVDKLVESNLLWGGTSWDWIFTIRQTENKALQKFIANYIVKPAPVLLKSVKNHQIAITVETLQHGALSYEPFIDKETSEDYAMMRTPLYWQFSIIMTTKTWPFMEQLNRIVDMQRENGIGYYWELKAAYNTTEFIVKQNLDKNAKPSENTEAVKLSTFHILGALFLLLFGDTAASICFLLEILLYTRKKRTTLLQKSVPKWKVNVAIKRRMP